MGNKNVKIIIIIKIFKLGVKLAYQIMYFGGRKRRSSDINTQMCKKTTSNKRERLKYR